MKSLISGIAYNWKGLKVGLKTPALLGLGTLRFGVILIITIVSAGVALTYHQDILSALWARPESVWIVWLWYLASWILALLLIGVSSLVSFLVAQLLFAVLIMDAMSRITERQVGGEEKEGERMPLMAWFFYLLKQEIPRTIIPVLIALVLMILGWLTPLGPVITVISSLVAAVFLAWDNTDLVPARRMEPFDSRFRFLRGNIMFHIGFGLWFLIPLLNILFLSFAPVGATLYYVEHVDSRNES